jgi:hypothetical protein
MVAFAFLFTFVFVGVGASTKGRPNQIRNALIAGLIAGVIGVVLLNNHQNSVQSSAPKYRTEINNFQVLPNDYVRVWFSVSNVGKGPGNPKCTIYINPVNTYGDTVGDGGFDSLSGNDTIQVGDVFRRYMDIIVSNNASNYVTDKSMISIKGC